MSQNDFSIANQGFPSFRGDLNSALQALASNSSGETEPATTYAYQWWYDSTDDILKIRNSVNDSWISFVSFDQSSDTWSLESPTVSSGLVVDNEGAAVLTVDRATSDGVVIDVKRGGSSVGSVSSVSGTSIALNSQGGEGHLQQAGTSRFKWSDSKFYPSVDGSYSLGMTGSRFQDIYLSGGVYLGGTGPSNKLDDCEEGTWTPSISSGSVTSEGSIYTKVGRFVNVKSKFNNFTDTTSGGAIVISGLPFNIRGTDQFATFGFSRNVQYSESAFWQVQDSNNTAQLRRNVNGSNAVDMTYSNITSSTNALSLDIFYMTD